MTCCFRQLRGFTFLELIMTIIILSIVVLFAAPYARNLYVRSQLEDAATQAMEYLQRAQAASAGQRDRGRYSVRFQSDRFTFFPGDTYHANALENETVLMPGNITVTWSLNGGGQQVTYYSGSGRTNQYGTVTFTNTSGNTIIIQVERTGLIYI